MIEDILAKVDKDLSFYTRSKKELLPMYISTRLEESLKQYYNELQESFDLLTSVDHVNYLRRVLKKL